MHTKARDVTKSSRIWGNLYFLVNLSEIKCWRISWNVTEFRKSCKIERFIIFQNLFGSYKISRNLWKFQRNLLKLAKKRAKRPQNEPKWAKMSQNEPKSGHFGLFLDLRQTIVGSSTFSRAYIQYFYLSVCARSRVFYYWGLGNIRIG